MRERWQRQDDEQHEHRNAVGTLSNRDLMVLGAALYWAEGTKVKPWRRAQGVVFMNSDPSLILVFLRHLDSLGVAREQASCRVSIHEDADVPTAEAFWRATVGGGVIWKGASLKRHTPKPYRYNRGPVYRGCLRVDVTQSAAIYRQIAGTWEGVAAAVAGSDDPPSSSG